METLLRSVGELRVELFLPVEGIFPNRKSVVKDYSFSKLKNSILFQKG